MMRYLSKVADLVEERSNDTIGFFDESEGKFEEDWIKEIWISTYMQKSEKNTVCNDWQFWRNQILWKYTMVLLFMNKSLLIIATNALQNKIILERMNLAPIFNNFESTDHLNQKII